MENMTFEQSLKELENISNQLENKDVALEDAIALFEKGIKLSKECSDKLKDAKQKIEIITDAEKSQDD